jgi:hypothetical protein
MKDFWDKLKRNFVPIIIGIVMMLVLWNYFNSTFIYFMMSLLMCSVAEAFALILSNIAVYVYTKLDFTSKILFGEDKKQNSPDEQASMTRVLGQIFIGVHVLVAITLGLLYWASNDGIIK